MAHGLLHKCVVEQSMPASCAMSRSSGGVGPSSPPTAGAKPRGGEHGGAGEPHVGQKTQPFKDSFRFNPAEQEQPHCRIVASSPRVLVFHYASLFIVIK